MAKKSNAKKGKISKKTVSSKKAKTSQKTKTAKARTPLKTIKSAKTAKATKSAKQVKSSAKANSVATAKKSQPAKKTEKLVPSVSSSLVGKTVPQLSVKNSKGEDVALTDFSGQKIVLYFYPKDDTPGCTIEGQEFTGLVEQFKAKNAVVLGVSRDSVQSHHKFICKYDYKIELLSDSEEKLCRFFDVIKEKNMYGKMVMGIERSTFIVDEQGVITQEYRKVKAEGHAAQVLADLN